MYEAPGFERVAKNATTGTENSTHEKICPFDEMESALGFESENWLSLMALFDFWLVYLLPANLFLKKKGFS